jgi:hypothetical protein
MKSRPIEQLESRTLSCGQRDSNAAMTASSGHQGFVLAFVFIGKNGMQRLRPELGEGGFASR